MLRSVVKIVNLVSSRPRVSKLEFFVALALVALAQTGKGALHFKKCVYVYVYIYIYIILESLNVGFTDPTIEQVAALASQNALPEPILDLDRLQASNSTFSTMPPSYRQNSVDPWGTTTATGRYQFTSSNPSTIPGTGHSAPGMINGLHSVLSGTGLPPEWWKRQENVRVTILGQQGFILNRYTVYEIVTEVS